MSEPTPQQILATPMEPDANTAGASTIGGYLIKLLATLWDEQELFNGKRPFGMSSWDGELTIALLMAGYLEGTQDEDGYWDWTSEQGTRGDRLIRAAIESLLPLDETAVTT